MHHHGPHGPGPHVMARTGSRGQRHMGLGTARRSERGPPASLKRQARSRTVDGVGSAYIAVGLSQKPRSDSGDMSQFLFHFPAIWAPCTPTDYAESLTSLYC